MVKIFISIFPILFFCTTWAKNSKHHTHHTPGEMNQKFLAEDLDVERWKTDFSDKERDVVKHLLAIVEALEIKANETVADVGAGTGLFIPALSQQVGLKGKVYAVDISPKFVKELGSLAQKQNLPQVEAVLGKLESTGLKSHSVDKILIVDTYHHFDNPSQMLTDLHSVLKPEGKLAIVDFDRKPNARHWIQSHIHKTKKEFITEIEANGFHLEKTPQIPFKENFMLIFSKK